MRSAEGCVWKVLTPYDPREGIGLKEAAVRSLAEKEIRHRLLEERQQRTGIGRVAVLRPSWHREKSTMGRRPARTLTTGACDRVRPICRVRGDGVARRRR
jgi:hypothetical protein